MGSELRHEAKAVRTRRLVWRCPFWLHVLGVVSAYAGVIFLMWALAVLAGAAWGGGF